MPKPHQPPDRCTYRLPSAVIHDWIAALFCSTNTDGFIKDISLCAKIPPAPLFGIELKKAQPPNGRTAAASAKNVDI